MDLSRALAAGTVAVVLAVTLVSGPLVGAVDLTEARDDDTSGELGFGSVEATIVSLPDDPRLVKGQYGSGAYYLRVGPATVDVSNVEGRPMLVYKLRIPELGYARGTTTFLDGGMSGSQRFSIDEAAVSPEKVTREAYDGELVVLVRSGNESRVIERRPVTVTVER
jgi:hypothetical protein